MTLCEDWRACGWTGEEVESGFYVEGYGVAEIRLMEIDDGGGGGGLLVLMLLLFRGWR